MKAKDTEQTLAEFQDALLLELHSSQDASELKRRIIELASSREFDQSTENFNAEMLELASYLVRRWGVRKP